MTLGSETSGIWPGQGGVFSGGSGEKSVSPSFRLLSVFAGAEAAHLEPTSDLEPSRPAASALTQLWVSAWFLIYRDVYFVGK